MLTLTSSGGMRISLKFKTGSFLLKSLPFHNTLTLVCPQSPSLPGLMDQKRQRGYMQSWQPLENKHLNGQMKKKKKRKKKQVLCHDSPYLSNDLVYTMSEICYACIGSCRHRYMNMKSESLSLESKQEHPISWVWAEPCLSQLPAFSSAGPPTAQHRVPSLCTCCLVCCAQRSHGWQCFITTSCSSSLDQAGPWVS